MDCFGITSKKTTKQIQTAAIILFIFPQKNFYVCWLVKEGGECEQAFPLLSNSITVKCSSICIVSEAEGDDVWELLQITENVKPEPQDAE